MIAVHRKAEVGMGMRLQNFGECGRQFAEPIALLPAAEDDEGVMRKAK